MKATLDRRAFSKVLALGLGAASLPEIGAQTPARRRHIGHTSITWPNYGGGPAVDPASIETIVRDVSGLGFWGVELFGNVPVAMEERAALRQLLHQYGDLPLISIVASPNCGAPAQLKESIQTMVAQATAAKKLGARIVLMNASGGRRGQDYNFNEHKANIVNALNEASKAMADLGLQAVLHQHTGTLVEKRDEVYAIMDAVDTRVVKAGFDVGQLSKAGSDPVPIVRDFLPVIEHLHLKDWDGGPNYAQYCPLGRGKVDLPAILDLMERKETLKGMVMVELDSSAPMPLAALETARIAKDYLRKLGYAFRN